MTRRFDSPEGADFFCGGGGASKGLLESGINLRFAANHDAIAIATHAAMHPGVDHFQVDLVEYDVSKMPAVQVAHFSPSCKHHSQANATKIYETPAMLANSPDAEARSGYEQSERSRVTMSCVLRYAEAHHPPAMVVENVVEVTKWGPNRDGSTFAWWLQQLHLMGYKTRPMFLNSAVFGVPQMRDRVFIVCWDQRMREPNLDHHVYGVCPTHGDCIAVQTFKKPTKAWPFPQWGKLGLQYNYCCVDCGQIAKLPLVGAETAIDWSDIGEQIGTRAKPLAQSTRDRIQRALDRWGGELPLVTMTRSADYGTLARPVTEPTGTMTTRADHALIYDYQGHATAPYDPASTMTTAETHALMAAQMVVAGNTFERGGSHCRTREMSEPTWAQHTTPAIGIAASAVFPFRKHTHPTDMSDPTFTQTADQRPGMITAAFAKNNGGPEDTTYHATSDPFNTITAKDSTSLASGPNRKLTVDDIHFRMLKNDEVRRIMGYPANWRAVTPDGSTPSKRDVMRLLGDGVTPPPLTYCTNALLEVL